MAETGGGKGQKRDTSNENGEEIDFTGNLKVESVESDDVRKNRVSQCKLGDT